MTSQTDKLVLTLNEVVNCFSAAYYEGLELVLAETTDERLKDLVERRLLYAFYAAQEVLNEMESRDD